MCEVRISYTIGDVFLVRNGKKRSIEAVPFKKSVRLRNKDRIITGARSYVVELSDEPGPTQTGTMVTAFPNSEFILEIKGIIRAIKLIQGLFRIATEKEVITPTAELRFPHGVNVFWIDIAKNDMVRVASEAVPLEVVHKKTKKSNVISFKQQVSVTREDILEPCGIDQRFKEAYKVWESLEQSRAKFLYGDMLERNVPQGLQELVAVIEEKTGERWDYDQTKYKKWLEEQKEFGEMKFDEVIKSKLPDFKSVEIEIERIIPMAESTTIYINKTVKYQGIDFKIISAEKTEEFRRRTAPKRADFLVLALEAKNNSTKQVIVFYDEEVRLINGSGETIPVEDYNIENNFDPKTETEGVLLFLVAKKDNKFKLQFGKKSVPKAEIELNLNEINGGG